jgi:hypothetical protein
MTERSESSKVIKSPRSFFSPRGRAHDRRGRGPHQPLLHFLVAAALVAATVVLPSVKGATLVTYFNFNDQNLVSDAPGAQTTTATVTRLTPSYVTPGDTSNIAPGDSIQGTTGNFALHLTPTANGAKSFQFSVSTTGLTDLSLSYATRGSGFTTETITYTTSGGGTGTIGTVTIASATTFQVPTFDLSGITALNNQTSVTFTIAFTPSNSGTFVDLDNIQLEQVPEPATVVGGLVGTLGLCWHKRQRLLGIAQLLRFSRKPAIA